MRVTHFSFLYLCFFYLIFPQFSQAEKKGKRLTQYQKLKLKASRNPTHPGHLLNMAHFLSQKGYCKKAIFFYLKESLVFSSSGKESLTHAAHCFQKLGRKKSANLIYNRLLLAGKLDVLNKKDILYQLGRNHIRTNYPFYTTKGAPQKIKKKRSRISYYTSGIYESFNYSSHTNKDAAILMGAYLKRTNNDEAMELLLSRKTGTYDDQEDLSQINLGLFYTSSFDTRFIHRMGLHYIKSNESEKNTATAALYSLNYTPIQDQKLDFSLSRTFQNVLTGEDVSATHLSPGYTFFSNQWSVSLKGHYIGLSGQFAEKDTTSKQAHYSAEFSASYTYKRFRFEYKNWYGDQQFMLKENGLDFTGESDLYLRGQKVSLFTSLFESSEVQISYKREYFEPLGQTRNARKGVVSLLFAYQF